jgi:hypothetical protein
MSDGELLEKLAALVPAPRFHLVRYFGILASAAKQRPSIVPVPPPASGVGILRTSRHLEKRKATCAQLQLVPTDGENFRRRCAGMSALRRPDAYSRRYRRSLPRSQDSRLSRPALTATPRCSRSPEPTPRTRILSQPNRLRRRVPAMHPWRQSGMQIPPYLNPCALGKRLCDPKDGIPRPESELLSLPFHNFWIGQG